MEEQEKFFKLPKSIVKHDILHTKNNLSLRLFLTIVGQACYKDGVQIKDTPIILTRGQWLRSNRKLQKDLGASSKSLIKAICWLEERKLIGVEPTGLGMIFTVKNFGIFQGNFEDEMENGCFPTENGCFPRENGGCFPRENNTKNYKQTKNYKKDSVNMLDSVKKEKENSVNMLNSVRGDVYDERDTSHIEWDKYPHLRF